MTDEKQPTTIRTAAIDGMMSDITYKGQILARTNKLDSAISASGIMGFALGLIISIVLVMVPVMLMGGI
ncbi:tetrahydromethanopterin S-methyltransferase subunit F [Methanogenium marinum]|uniref:Tetrahydromethanopterin S-methyltransferase subunit F n=1 Tax=Methanogenium marinum TaxID=348610 RepID=A0A9Q4KV08_9EURY|nr:tetrahydromethanopterin S-methyltransferase subunit F [Methanogenium marinum]MDE4907890.1 tetrahydromethanopterin S-methyltransferase subunit F [Methanogenium marinum]